MPSKKVTVRYTGPANVRSFTAEDFTRHAITDQGDVEFNHDNRWVNTVSPEAAGFLIGSGEFEKTTLAEVKKEETEEEPEQQVPQPGEALPSEGT